MHQPETPLHRKPIFERTRNEIERMRNPMEKGAPKNAAPLTFSEYREAVGALPPPTPEQLERFLRDIRSDDDLWREAVPGTMLLPLLMPHEHGMPEFMPGRVERWGHLYYYFLNEKGLTVAPRDIAYMNAVLPPEIMENAARIPENFTPDPAGIDGVLRDFESAVKRMLRMVFGDTP